MSDFPLPAAIAKFISAANSGELQSIVRSFADDALVNDQLQEYWGKREIHDWAVRDLIKEHLTIRIVDSIKHYRQFVVRAHFEGDFDKRGLPDPLSLTLYFALQRSRIVQLIILRNQHGI